MHSHNLTFFLTVAFLPIYWALELDLRDLSVLRSQFSLTDNVDNKWQGEEHVPEEPIAFAPNRFFRQARSTSGKLAYVVFGITADCGVYYNWYVECVIIPTAPDIFFRPAARQYLSKFRPYEKPDNRGYESYLEADEAWSFYKETGVVPLAPLDGSVAASISDRDRSATAHPSSPHHTPQADRTHPASRTGIPAIFYIVHEGYSPGVYNSL